MKVLVLSVVFAVALGAVPQLHTKSPEWVQFKSKHGKKYHNETEEARRLGIFAKNKDRIDQHNSAGQATFQLGLNEYADMDPAEFTKTMNGLKGTIPSKSVSTTLKATAATAVATSIDWRNLGAVTPVKNQGSCGSCWTFSATGALEAQNFIKTGKLVSLSESNLVDCSSTSTYGNAGCNGGSMVGAFSYVKNNGGIDTEASYPYTPVQNTCKYNAANKGGTASGYVQLATASDSALMAAVSSVGPVSVGIDASHSSFQFYSGGIYNETACSPSFIDHGVLVVGYGNNGTAGSGDYWIVKNSWGTTWGESGYIRMTRNVANFCGISTMASYPTV